VTDDKVYPLERVEGEGWIHLRFSERPRANRRVFMMGDWTFANMQKGIESILGEGASSVLYEAGLSAGARSAKVLLDEWEERGEAFIEKWISVYEETGVGWFKTKKIEIDYDEKKALIQIVHPFTTSQYGESTKPICYFLCGYFAGALETLLQENMTCEETFCTAKGDPYCEFKLEKY